MEVQPSRGRRSGPNRRWRLTRLISLSGFPNAWAGRRTYACPLTPVRSASRASPIGTSGTLRDGRPRRDMALCVAPVVCNPTVCERVKLGARTSACPAARGGTVNTATESGVRTRAGGIAAIFFAVLFVIGVICAVADSPDIDESNAKWLSFYRDSGNRREILIGAFILAVAVIALLVFAGALRERLRATPASAWLGTAAVAGGVAFAAMISVFATALGSVPAIVAFNDGPLPRDADIMRVMQSLGFGALLIFGMAAAGVLVVCASIAAGRAALYPRWMVIVGVIFGVVIALLGWIFIPMVLVPIWALLTGIFMLRRQAATVT